MNQLLRPLGKELARDVAAKREWVIGHYDEAAREEYESVEGKLVLLETILSAGWIEPHETLKLQCLGIAFGDALAQQLNLKWVEVEDEYGRDPALQVEGASILTFPQTAISKRIEAGESVEIRALFHAACQKIREARRVGT